MWWYIGQSDWGGSEESYCALLECQQGSPSRASASAGLCCQRKLRLSRKGKSTQQQQQQGGGQKVAGMLDKHWPTTSTKEDFLELLMFVGFVQDAGGGV
jgi:hypothetical protein